MDLQGGIIGGNNEITPPSVTTDDLNFPGSYDEAESSSRYCNRNPLVGGGGEEATVALEMEEDNEQVKKAKHVKRSVAELYGLPASKLPGTLIIDPLMRRQVEEYGNRRKAFLHTRAEARNGGDGLVKATTSTEKETEKKYMQPSEHAIWFVVAAIKEYAKVVISEAIASMKQRGSDFVRNDTGGTKYISALDISKCITENPALSGGGASSNGQSRGTFGVLAGINWDRCLAQASVESSSLFSGKLRGVTTSNQ